MKESELREAIVSAGRILSQAALAPGTSGNLSIRFDGGVLLTPTNSRLGSLQPDILSLLDIHGSHVNGPPATKEARLHLGVYREQPDASAIVHLHSPYCVAVSCLTDLDSEDALPPLTAYALMRFGAVSLVPFFPPGSSDLARAVQSAARTHRAILLANHGSLIVSDNMASAGADAEELEQAAKVALLVRNLPTAPIPELFRTQLGEYHRPLAPG